MIWLVWRTDGRTDGWMDGGQTYIHTGSGSLTSYRTWKACALQQLCVYNNNVFYKDMWRNGTILFCNLWLFTFYLHQNNHETWEYDHWSNKAFLFIFIKRFHEPFCHFTFILFTDQNHWLLWSLLVCKQLSTNDR